MLRSYRFIGLTILVLVIDSITKEFAALKFPFQLPQQVTSFFNLTLTHNTGAAFGLLNGAGGYEKWLFAGIAIIVSAAIVVWLYRLQAKQAWMESGLCLILGGALGNLLDRFTHGYVIDFLEFHYRSWYFPSFNIADAAITIGALLLIIDSFLGKKL